MASLTENDSDYRLAVESVGNELVRAMTTARLIEFDLESNDLTIAVLLRLKSFFLTQGVLKAHLNKVYATPAADFFVETICFFLKIFLEQKSPRLTVASERNILPKRGALRPDISIWKNGKVVAAIECKTQLGWNRTGWLDDFLIREKRLKENFPSATLFLLVMTGSNWPGFGNDHRVGKQFFLILNSIWPDTFDTILHAKNQVVHPVENLFSDVLACTIEN